MATSPGVRTGLWVGLATGLYGVSFGALGVASGLDVWQTCALSLLMFTGGSQFAFIGVLAGGGAGVAAWAAASLLGVRNGVYGMRLKAWLRPTAAAVPAMAQLTIDESMAVSTAQDEPAERWSGFWAAGLGVFVCWNLATLLGALAGNVVGDVRAWGLDGAAVAAFVGLTWPHLKARDPVVIAVVSAAATILAVPLVPPGVPILLAGLVAVAAHLLRERPGRAGSCRTAGIERGQRGERLGRAGSS
ncbi:MAG: AzlC family ABC transporter permease, partial [Propionibacteriaceae bacterium]|nr:AzlC family ABC transporter permease [Propionibacteriaceae bacterium]